MRRARSEGGEGGGWLVSGARVALGPRASGDLTIVTEGDRIAEVRSGSRSSTRRASPSSGQRALPLDGCLVLPGLINAHDHLEFSLFPRLGRGPFANAVEWARRVYRPSEPPVQQHLQVPKRERLIWGGLKNLLGGVTTVCHHNPYEPRVFGSSFPVRVVRRFGWAHSLEFSEDIAVRFAAAEPDEPFILHLGEATDEAGRRQVYALDAMGALDGRTVLVHGVALDEDGLDLVERRKASVIWCPSSNLFTLGATLDPGFFRRDIPTALATDSSLTGKGDLLDEIQEARGLGRVPCERLYEMVLSEAAAILRLRDGEGTIGKGLVADLVAVRDPGGLPCEVLTGDASAGGVPEPVLVMVGGKIRLVAEDLADGLPAALTRRFERIKVEGRQPCLVDVGVAALVASAKSALGDEPVRLAGKVVEVATARLSGQQV